MSRNTETVGARTDNRSGRDRRATQRSTADRRRIRSAANRGRTGKRIGRTLLAVLLTGAATVYGCNSDRIAGPSPSPTKAAAPDLLVVSTPAQQQATSTEFPDPCTGETVQGTQTAQYVFDVDDQDATIRIEDAPAHRHPGEDGPFVPTHLGRGVNQWHRGLSFAEEAGQDGRRGFRRRYTRRGDAHAGFGPRTGRS